MAELPWFLSPCVFTSGCLSAAVIVSQPVCLLCLPVDLCRCITRTRSCTYAGNTPACVSCSSASRLWLPWVQFLQHREEQRKETRMRVKIGGLFYLEKKSRTRLSSLSLALSVPRQSQNGSPQHFTASLIFAATAWTQLFLKMSQRTQAFSDRVIRESLLTYLLREMLDRYTERARGSPVSAQTRLWSHGRWRRACQKS